MNIIYASNNDYAKFLGISMLSLFDNNREINEIVVYILDQSICSANKEHLLQIARHYDRKICFIDIHDFTQYLPF